MRKPISTIFKYSFLAGCLAAASYSVGAETITLKAVSGFPTQTDYTKQFLQFVDEVNNDKDLGVKINFLGGPEAVPTYEQGKALKNGVVSMVYGSVSYYFGLAPEGNALLGSKIDAEQARKNGGMDVLNGFYKKRINGRLLGWFAPTSNFFHIYTEKEPQFDENGKVKGKVLIRSNEQYRDLLNAMGFAPQRIQVPDVYTGLQRGVINGVTWPLVGINDLGWVDYLHYMIEPGFYTNTTGVMLNLDDWNKMSKEQREKLQKIAVDFEQKSKADFQALEQKTKDGLIARGIKIVTLEGKALERLKKLENSPWEALSKYNESEATELRKYFAP